MWPLSDPSRRFPLDVLFPPSSSNSDVYAHLVAPLITSVVHGFNATVFAYGQTASGEEKIERRY